MCPLLDLAYSSHAIIPKLLWDFLAEHDSKPFPAYLSDNALCWVLVMPLRLYDVEVNAVLPNLMHKL